MDQGQDIKQLERRVTQLEQKVADLDGGTIKIVGDFDGTNVPVTVKGIRRRIATSTP